MATVQLRNPTEGRAYFDRKKATGKTSMEAMRALRRRLSDIVYRHMLNDAITEATLEEVRAAAGVSGSQIYHYFADKQALLLAVIDYQTEAVLALQAPHLERLDTISELRAWRDMLVENQKRLQCRGGCRSGPSAARQPRPTPKPDSRSPQATYAGRKQSGPA